MSALSCSEGLAEYRDWHGVCDTGITDLCIGGMNPGTSCTTDADCQDVLYVSGSEILPSSLYMVQTVKSGLCDPTNENSFSVPLGISTPLWGDIVDVASACPNGPPNGLAEIHDVLAALHKFQNLLCAPIKGRADVDPIVPNRKVDITDVLRISTAPGFPYPFTPPAACP